MNELTTQLQNLLEDSKNILILSHQKIDGDGLSAMLVLKKLLETEGKEVTALSYDEIPEIYHFLPGINEVESSMRNSNDFIISLKADGAEVDKLKYSVDGDVLNIVVTPKKGTFVANDISAKQAIGNYDLIFVLDAGDLDHLGKFYEENTEMFYSTPVINIDHHATNTGFGQLNFVDVTAASTTQIVYKIIQELLEDPKSFINEDVATLLLTGLIVDTGSFQHTNTSPKSLEFAADLIELGARQQEIIQNVYKTKQLSTLKLWGRVLAKIQEDPIHKIVWSTITKEDLQETGASVEEAEGLIDELMTNAPGAEIVILLKHGFDGTMSASLRSTNISVDTLAIAQHFGGGGHKNASGFTQKGHNFSLFTADVIGYAEKYQEERLNLTEEDIEALEAEYNIQRKQIQEETRSEEKQEQSKEQRDILSEISSEAPKKQEEGNVVIRKKEESKSKQVSSSVSEQDSRHPEGSEGSRKGKDEKTESPKKETKKTETSKQEGKQQNSEKPDQKVASDAEEAPKKKRKRRKKKTSSSDQQTTNSEQSSVIESGVKQSREENNQSKPQAQAKEEKVEQAPVAQAESAPVVEAAQAEPVQETPVQQKVEPVQQTQTTPVQEAVAAEPVQAIPVAESTPTQEVQAAPTQEATTTPVVEQAPTADQTQPAYAEAVAGTQVQQQAYEQQQQAYAQQQAAQAQQQSVQTQPTKEQCAQYAQYYAQQLQQMNPQTQEYAQVYQYYQYYAQLAQ